MCAVLPGSVETLFRWGGKIKRSFFWLLVLSVSFLPKKLSKSI